MKIVFGKIFEKMRSNNGQLNPYAEKILLDKIKSMPHEKEFVLDFSGHPHVDLSKFSTEFFTAIGKRKIKIKGDGVKTLTLPEELTVSELDLSELDETVIAEGLKESLQRLELSGVVINRPLSLKDRIKRLKTPGLIGLHRALSLYREEYEGSPQELEKLKYILDYVEENWGSLSKLKWIDRIASFHTDACVNKIVPAIFLIHETIQALRSATLESKQEALKRILLYQRAVSISNDSSNFPQERGAFSMSIDGVGSADDMIETYGAEAVDYMMLHVLSKEQNFSSLTRTIPNYEQIGAIALRKLKQEISREWSSIKELEGEDLLAIMQDPLQCDPMYLQSFLEAVFPELQEVAEKSQQALLGLMEEIKGLGFDEDNPKLKNIRAQLLAIQHRAEEISTLTLGSPMPEQLQDADEEKEALQRFSGVLYNAIESKKEAFLERGVIETGIARLERGFRGEEEVNEQEMQPEGVALSPKTKKQTVFKL